MGGNISVQTVQNFAVTLQNACSQPDFDQLLENPELLGIISNLFGQLPAQYQTRIRRGNISQDRAFKRISSIASVSLTPTARNSLLLWKGNPSKFLEPCTKTPDFSSNPLNGYLNFLLQLDQDKELVKIRGRLSLIPLARLKAKFNEERLNATSHDGFADIITNSELITDNKDAISGRIRAWINAGGRYESLASELGGLGSLCCLPDEVGDSIWEKHLQKGGDSRIASVALLKTKGVTEEACKNIGKEETSEISANEVAKKVVDYIWDKIDKASFLEYSPPPLAETNTSRPKKRPATARQSSNKRHRSNKSSQRPPRKKRTEQTHRDGLSSHDNVSDIVPRPAQNSRRGGVSDPRNGGENPARDSLNLLVTAATENSTHADSSIGSDSHQQLSVSEHSGNPHTINGRRNITGVVFNNLETTHHITGLTPRNHPTQIGAENATGLGALATAAAHENRDVQQSTPQHSLNVNIRHTTALPFPVDDARTSLGPNQHTLTTSNIVRNHSALPNISQSQRAKRSYQPGLVDESSHQSTFSSGSGRSSDGTSDGNAGVNTVRKDFHGFVEGESDGNTGLSNHNSGPGSQSPQAPNHEEHFSPDSTQAEVQRSPIELLNTGQAAALSQYQSGTIPGIQHFCQGTELSTQSGLLQLLLENTGQITAPPQYQSGTIPEIQHFCQGTELSTQPGLLQLLQENTGQITAPPQYQSGIIPGIQHFCQDTELSTQPGLLQLLLENTGQITAPPQYQSGTIPGIQHFCQDTELSTEPGLLQLPLENIGQITGPSQYSPETSGNHEVSPGGVPWVPNVQV
ncbi:hypothetical protein FQN54_004711 [Arachnomyces sp. PD_36]|nr:hypothetical protein FQN54_004711 [Arachnomyces sp. PD_36]